MVLATVASVLATAGLGLISFVPLVGLAVGLVGAPCRLRDGERLRIVRIAGRIMADGDLRIGIAAAGTAALPADQRIQRLGRWGPRCGAGL